MQLDFISGHLDRLFGYESEGPLLTRKGPLARIQISCAACTAGWLSAVQHWGRFRCWVFLCVDCRFGNVIFKFKGTWLLNSEVKSFHRFKHLAIFKRHNYAVWGLAGGIMVKLLAERKSRRWKQWTVLIRTRTTLCQTSVFWPPGKALTKGWGSQTSGLSEHLRDWWMRWS